MKALAKSIAISLACLLRACVPTPAFADSSYPDVGQLLCNPGSSYSGPNVRSGCAIRYDEGNCALECGANLTGVLQYVALTEGTRTVVTNRLVTKDSMVECGCQVPSGKLNAACDLGGKVLAYKSVESVTTGTYTIAHAFAIGDEHISCVVQ